MARELTLRVGAAESARALVLLLVERRRLLPQPPTKGGAGKPRRFPCPRRRLAAADVAHEALEAVVPVVVPGNGVDGLRKPFVRHVELLLVFVDVADRVQDVAADEQEVGVLRVLQQWRDERVLREIAFAGVADEQEGEVTKASEVERQLLRLDAGEPRATQVVRRIVEAREEVVPRLPERSQVPEEPRRLLLRHQVDEGARGAPPPRA